MCWWHVDFEHEQLMVCLHFRARGKIISMNKFTKLSRKAPISLEESLTGGQSFRWKRIGRNVFRGVAFNILWELKQDKDTLYYKVIAEIPYGAGEIADPLIKIRMKVDAPKNSGKRYYDSLLAKYFQLEIDLDVECQKWMSAHEHFRDVAKKRAIAIRVLDQDPVENLFSFICSQNNHINRITGLVEKLATLYGTHIVDIDGVSYYNFPAVEKLAEAGVEEELRKNSFGYRAKFINKSAQQICQKGGLKWFSELQQKNYKEAHAELITLTGIGPKVADCICLMSLGHLSAIPVDTHIFKIAQQHYCKDLGATKSVTPAVYNQIGNRFREVYGPLAGWAQTVLFCADLKQFEATETVAKVAKPRKRKGE